MSHIDEVAASGPETIDWNSAKNLDRASTSSTESTQLQSAEDVADRESTTDQDQKKKKKRSRKSVKFRFDPKSDTSTVRGYLGKNGNVKVVKHMGSNILMAQRVYNVGGHSSKLRKTIRQELLAVRRDPPNEILPYYGVHIDPANDTLSIWMQYMDVGSFKEISEDCGPLRIDFLGKVALSVLSALDYLLKEHKMLHRDVRPAHILMNSRGDIKLGGLGLSAVVENSVASSLVATPTHYYTAPECLSGSPWTAKADVWSFGITMMELATGQCPYEDNGDLFHLLTQIVDGPVPQLPSSDAFPPCFHLMIEQCLLKDPKSRPKVQTLLSRDIFIAAAKRTPVDLETLALGIIDERMGNPPRKIARSAHKREWRHGLIPERSEGIGEISSSIDSRDLNNETRGQGDMNDSTELSNHSLELEQGREKSTNEKHDIRKDALIDNKVNHKVLAKFTDSHNSKPSLRIKERGRMEEVPRNSRVVAKHSDFGKLLMTLTDLAFPMLPPQQDRDQPLALCSQCDELLASDEANSHCPKELGWKLRGSASMLNCPLCQIISDSSKALASGEAKSDAAVEGEFQIPNPRLEVGKLDDFMDKVLTTTTSWADTRTDSECAFQLAAAWMHNCINTHRRCQRVGHGEPPNLPKRVIDVGTSDAPQVPRLCEGESKRGFYLTLSYRWNEDCVATAMTVQGNLEAHRQGIDLGSLPQIMQDAVHISRKLGLRYLWIDALCIIQDSHDDWQAEAADMANIYKNSTITLAAGVDTGDGHGSAGCFQARLKSHIRPFRCQSTWQDGTAKYIFADRTLTKDGSRPQSVLDTRGWVLQEQLLSPRVLTYANGELFWDCVSLNASESFPSGIPAFYDTDLKAVDFRLFKEAILLRNDDAFGLELKPARIYKLWHNIVEEYSARRLTLGTDKLAALAGLAKEVVKILNDDFVLGLWKKTLWRDLLWWAKDPESAGRPIGFVAPTWSWASLNGSISYGLPGRDDEDFLIPCVEILNVETPSELSALCQPRLSGWIQVRAGVIGPQSPLWQEWLHGGLEGHPSKKHVGWRPDLLERLLNMENVYVLVVAVSNYYAYGLGIMKVGENGRYRRLGVVYSRGNLKSHGWDVKEQRWKKETGLAMEEITLI